MAEQTSNRAIALNGCITSLDSFFKNWKNDKRNVTGDSKVRLAIPGCGEDVILEIDTDLYNLDVESYVKNNWDMYEVLNDGREKLGLPRRTQEEVIAEMKETMSMINR